jgi:hypothetical protein
MIYYAHTAEDSEGKRLPESPWKLLSDHLRYVLPPLTSPFLLL